MTWNYVAYIAIGLGIIINVVYCLIRPKANDTSNDRLLSQLVKIVNYGILTNVVISFVFVTLKIYQIINYNQYIVVMYVSFILIVLSSLFGFGEIINRLLQIRRNTPELLKEVSPKARMRFFLQFAAFVFGSVWILTDSLITFNWLDIISKLITFEPIQRTPVIGIMYIVSIYLISIFKVSEFVDIGKIRLRRSK